MRCWPSAATGRSTADVLGQLRARPVIVPEPRSGAITALLAADTVAPTDDLRRRAGRLLSVHPLRAADALQLAAALIWCEEQPHGEVFVTLDVRLGEAAAAEGFVIHPAAT